jgi:peptidoglycan hydrolase FlgJ
MAISSSGGPQFKGLRRYVTPEEQNAKLKEVAKKYENQFMREMVKSMRGTVQDSGLIKVGMGEKIFRDDLDSEYVNNWSDRGGVGFADVIYKQLLDKYGAQLGITQAQLKPKGPLPIDEKANFQGFAPRSLAQAPDSKKTNLVFERQIGDNKNGVTPITNPWSGKYLGAQQINQDEYKVELLHDNGLKSRMVFRGLINPEIQPGPMHAGETLGLLSPEAKQLSWFVDSQKDDRPLNRTEETKLPVLE